MRPPVSGAPRGGGPALPCSGPLLPHSVCDNHASATRREGAESKTHAPPRPQQPQAHTGHPPTPVPPPLPLRVPERKWRLVLSL